MWLNSLQGDLNSECNFKMKWGSWDKKKSINDDGRCYDIDMCEKSYFQLASYHHLFNVKVRIFLLS